MNKLTQALDSRKKTNAKQKIARTKSVFSKDKNIDVPKGLYEKCPTCKETLSTKMTIDNQFIKLLSEKLNLWIILVNSLKIRRLNFKKVDK